VEITGNCISCVVFFFFGGSSIEVDINFHKQGVTVGPSSSRDNAGGHVSEMIEDHMDVDDAHSVGCGTFSKSSLYILDH
jgi:hypothetical protein